jgi:ubiquinone/menaquinone biosynthesis C-methylase UbiE
LFTLLRQTGDKTIVDIGCGREAFFLQSCKNNFKKRIGIDLDIDTELFTSLNIEPCTGDALSVLSGMESSCVDVITFFLVMEHIAGREEILKECRRVLRKNGIVFINSPSWFGKFVLENVIIRFFDHGKLYTRQVDTHVTYFSPAQMWQCVKDSGFVSSEIRIWRSNFLCSISAVARKKYE